SAFRWLNRRASRAWPATGTSPSCALWRTKGRRDFALADGRPAKCRARDSGRPATVIRSMTDPKIALRTEARARRANLAAAMPGFARAIAAFAQQLPLA